MDFGQTLRRMRTDQGIGIKTLGPQLGVSYTYLSKLEGNVTRPSEELLDRISLYFGCDRDQLYITADRVPPDILSILREYPDDAIQVLRERFQRGRKSA
ncbi:MAG: helix-turn-helix transcriptional regulator [Candidatus Dormibacteria bacterium]|jgi:transcriptional regulator with XRE-family HTH domain